MSSVVNTLPERVPAEPETPEPPLTVIERRRGWAAIDFRELWRYRELLVFLAWRDIVVRYKQAALGAAWALLQPLATMGVFLVFLKPRGADAPGYALLAFTGLWAWTFFGNAVTTASQSVVANQNLITKVYFPRMLIPMAAVAAGLVDFLVGGLVFAALVPFGPGDGPGWSALALGPALVGLLALAAVGVGAFLAALTVAYRDFKHVIPFAVQLWMFATPAIYDPTPREPLAQALLALNPAHGLILNFRQAMLGRPPEPVALAVSAAAAVALVAAGFAYFRRVERGFADII